MASLLAGYGDRFSDRMRLTRVPKHTIGQIKRLQGERRKIVDRRGTLKATLTEVDIHKADTGQLIEMRSQQIALLDEYVDELEKRIKAAVNLRSSPVPAPPNYAHSSLRV